MLYLLFIKDKLFAFEQTQKPTMLRIDGRHFVENWESSGAMRIYWNKIFSVFIRHHKASGHNWNEPFDLFVLIENLDSKQEEKIWQFFRSLKSSRVMHIGNCKPVSWEALPESEAVRHTVEVVIRRERERKARAKVASLSHLARLHKEKILASGA